MSVSIMTSCVDSRDSTADYTVDWDNAECTPASLADIYSEIEFIPLENKRECMLSNVKSMSVTDKGFIIYHRAPLPVVALFDADGRYVRNIGSLGHARGEFQDNVVCVASSPSGDTISIVTYEGVNVYDGKGRYVWSMTQTDDFMKNVVWTPKGYAFSTDYHGSEYALYFTDEHFKKGDGWDANDGVCISDFGFCAQSLCSDGAYVYYYDQFKPSFYRVSLAEGHDVKEIALTSSHMVRMEEYDKRNTGEYIKDDVPMDYVWNYIPYKGKLCGYATVQGGKQCEFVMDVENGTVKLYELGKWVPAHSSVHDGYQYTMLSQIDFMNLAENSGSDAFDGLDKCNFNQVKDSITEQSNYIVMKMKRRDL